MLVLYSFGVVLFWGFFEVCPSSHELFLTYMQTYGFFSYPLVRCHLKQRYFCVAARQAVVGLGTSIVMQCKAEWGGSVIRLLMKGQKRSPLGMYFVDICPRN